MANALGLDLAAVHQARDTRALNAQNQQINALNIQAAQAKAAQAPKINSLAQKFSTGSLQDKKDAALRMGQYDPARSKQMFEMYSKMSEEQKAQTKELTANVAKYGVGMLQETDPQKWVQSYTQNLTAIAQKYGPEAVKDAPGLNEPIEKQRAWVQEQVNDAMGFQEVYKAAQPDKVSPNTALAKAKADLDNGLITQAQYDQIAQSETEQKGTYGQPIGVMGPDGKPTYVQVDKSGNVRALDGYAPIPKGMKIESDGQGVFTLTQGDLTPSNGQELTNPAKNTVQKELAKLEETTARIADIDKRYSPDFMTYQGGFKALVSKAKDKANIGLSDEEKTFLKDYTKFRTLINREFNSYRKEITGAAASVQELESLKKATISEDQSPAQFEANMEIYKDELMRSMRIKRRLLREGLAVGSKEFGGRFDDIYMGGGDDDETARYTELLDSGMEEEDILKKMVTEGY